MKPCWMFMILLSCCLSHATEPHTICACKEHLKIVCLPAGHHVMVPCPELTDKELAFFLYKEEEVIYNHTCNDKNTPNFTSLSGREDVKLQVNNDNKTVNFMLSGVNASSYGIYKCERVVMFPPPLLRVNSTLRILVRVEGEQCKVSRKSVESSTKPPKAGDQKEEPLWIWIVGLTVLLTYGLIVTIIAICIWVKLRRTDSQCDYMNTKPKAGRDRKKKRGAQNQFPRYL